LVDGQSSTSEPSSRGRAQSENNEQRTPPRTPKKASSMPERNTGKSKSDAETKPASADEGNTDPFNNVLNGIGMWL
jgi:hypothetical protein